MRPRALGEEVVMRTGSHHVPAHPGRVGDELDGPSAPARLDALRRLAEPVARAAGMDLESVHLSSVGKRRLLRVVVDAVGGVGVDDMAVVSQTLSAKLDSSGLMGDRPFTLEVTSPGVDRPLTEQRHWQRAVGRMVQVAVVGQRGQAVRGRITAANDHVVAIDIEGVRYEFGFGELGPGKVQVEFRRDDMGESGGH